METIRSGCGRTPSGIAELIRGQTYFEDLTSAPRAPSATGLRRFLPARFFFGFVVYGNLFQIVGFENLTTVHAVHVVDPIPAHQKFRAVMLTGWHSKAKL